MHTLRGQMLEVSRQGRGGRRLPDWVVGGPVLVYALCALAMGHPAQAAVFNIASGDVAALITAINTANGNGEDDTINLAAGTCLMVRPRAQAVCLPPAARAVFQAEGFCGLEQGEDFCLTDGASLLHLRAREGRGEAQLAPAFFHKPGRLQSTFWVFGLLKLLRPAGLYSLHAAGVVTPAGLGVLIVGPSGSSKSTLTIGLVRQGWRYLSDDAILLRQQPEGIAALAFRQHVYVDACAAARYADLPLGEEVPDTAGHRRQQVRLEEVYPGQQALTCLPCVLLFARIVPQAHSIVRLLETEGEHAHRLASHRQHRP